MSDFLLQKSPGRGRRYHDPPGIWFSEDIKRWMVTAPELIRQAMYDDAFAVPTYDVSPVTAKFDVDLRHLEELRTWFPIAVEGERHAFLREKMARHAVQHTRAALDVLVQELEARRTLLAAWQAGTPFCFFRELVRPVLLASICRLSAVSFDAALPLENLPLQFDTRLPLKRRKAINDLSACVFQSMPAGLPDEEKFLRLALLTLGVNTLLGSAGLTVVERMAAFPGARLAAVYWGSDLIRTGLPLVEKWAVRDAELGGKQIRAGQGLRLFIEAGGVGRDGTHSHSDLFFAVGGHKCIGMSFSKQVWTRLAGFLGSIDRTLRVLEIRERAKDYVFNFPEAITVQFDD